MPAKRTSNSKATGPRSTSEVLDQAIEALRRAGSEKVRREMGTRYGIHVEGAFGVLVSEIQRLSRDFGPSHDLALALWKTGIYDARMLAVFVDVVEEVTPAQMERWCRDFDNWGIVDTACFKLFDQTPHAKSKIVAWTGRTGEFQRRAGFALLASCALHRKDMSEDEFVDYLPLAESASGDERNFVWKSVSWALRAMAGRGPRIRAAVSDLASDLSKSDDKAKRRLGKDVLKDLTRPRASATTKKQAKR